MNLQCPLHAQPLSRICIDEKCDQQPFLCGECFKTHTCPRFDVQNGIEEFAKKLNVNLTHFEKMNVQFKQLDFESFGHFIRTQKLKITDDIQQLKKEINSKCDNLESKLLVLLDEQVQIYNKNIQQFKQSLKETEKFSHLQKSSELSMLNIKLYNHNDPINVMRKLKSQLLNYSNCISSGKLKQLQESLILLQSQTVFPPTYKSQDFQKIEFTRVINYFNQYLLDVEHTLKQYIKYYPITDLEQKNIHLKQMKKEQKLIEEDQCVTSLLLLPDSLIYSLNDMTIKIREKNFNEVEVIQCDTQINCIIEITSEITESSTQVVNKNQDIDVGKAKIALGGDEFILIWVFNQNQIFQNRKISHSRMSKVVVLMNFDNLLLVGDWDGQILGYDLKLQNPIYILDTQTTILFQLVKSAKFVISASKCDMEQGGVIFWNYSSSDLYQEKRLKLFSVQKMTYSNEQLYVVDNKYKLFIYDCKLIEIIKQFICSESFVNEIAIDNNQIYILNQTCLKTISDQLQWTYQTFEDFPCLQCRQYYQSRRLLLTNNILVFIRHLHQCKHEEGEEEKCSMKTTIYIMQ